MQLLHALKWILTVSKSVKDVSSVEQNPPLK